HDYVRTARAKGLHELTVIRRHVLKNGLIPVLTVWGNQIAFLVGGTIVIETVFSLPGMGTLSLNAINFRDYTQLQGNVLVLSAMAVGVNLLVDLTYGWLDPRIRYG